ncbi:GNAT family N-acetyltransferase [Streptomyces sp. H27-D2]|uniref:GNAT family N-acetyltransferase n=1 Tax=Streptomyces sp. H27-D2 TaxID=3046304 RepID=UPI002DB9A307|nr:GNAT family N-acetyltransferase [Streptomyces sp. H27-D2]MEC4020083.1 GNAT family N-acetyltransferase [Streptomyces sp. H27-D2]
MAVRNVHERLPSARSDQAGSIRIVIRAATPADLDAVADLHSRTRTSYYRGRLPDALLDDPAERARCHAAWEHALARPDGGVLCAVRDGAVAAVASFRTPRGAARTAAAPARAAATVPRDVTLHQFHVDPEHWRSGIGSGLHDACVTAWQTASRSTAHLEVFWHNQRARAFYARHGWQPDAAHRPAPDDTHLRLTLAVPLACGNALSAAPVVPSVEETPAHRAN